MQFLNPLFWLGALALVAPILIHLVRREKKDRFPFASLMFFRRLPFKEYRRQQLKYLLLLLLRCLGLLLLVASFAKPVVTADWLVSLNPVRERSVAVLLDRSLSVSRPDSWERALERLREDLQALSERDQVLLIQFGQTPEVLSLWQKPSELLSLFPQRVEPSFEAASYEGALRAAAEQLNELAGGGKEIHFISDLQSNGLDDAGSWKLPPGIRVAVRRLELPARNLYVEEARLEQESFGPVYPFPVQVRIGVSPPQPLAGEALLYVSGQLLQRQTFQLDSAGAGEVTFSPFELKEEFTRGRIVLTPEDELAEDNVFYFSLRRREPSQVVILAEEGGRTSFYIEQALSAGSNLPFRVEVRDSHQGPPSQAQVVVLNDVRRWPDAGWAASFLETGGGLLVALGPNTDPRRLPRRWFDLLGVEVVGKSFARTRAHPFTGITEVRWEHPLLSIFQGTRQSAFLSTQYYGYWEVKAGPEARVLARFGEGAPALVERTHGRGRVLLFPSSLDSIWNDFPLRASYVPLWHQAVRLLLGWSPQPAARRVGELLPLQGWKKEQLPGTAGTWSILDPQGKRLLGLDAESPDFLPLSRPGFYEIRSEKRSDWIAANVPLRESDLSVLAEEDFLAKFVPGEERLEAEALAGQGGERGQPVWWFLLGLAMLIFVLESIVAHRYRISPGTST